MATSTAGRVRVIDGVSQRAEESVESPARWAQPVRRAVRVAGHSLSALSKTLGQE